MVIQYMKYYSVLQPMKTHLLREKRLFSLGTG